MPFNLCVGQSFLYLSMLSEDKIKAILLEFLKKQEGTGTQTGGSGHLSDIGVFIDKLVISDQTEEVEVSVEFIVLIETEFTYYPDNPPKEYKYIQNFKIKMDGKINSYSDKEFIGGSNTEPENFI